MKGVVLAGGLGTRLSPLTQVTNKHLLPVYDRPMIYFPIQTLLNAGIDEILLVTGGEHAGDFLKLLGNGKSLGLRDLQYTYQEGEGGIADALLLAEDFADRKKICVALGDNIIERNIRAAVGEFFSQPTGAKILMKEVDHPEQFGVPRIENGRILEIIEKPTDPPSRFAVTGIYMYDRDVFDIAKTLDPSSRGELEITDVNNAYIRRGDLTYNFLDGWWTDAGTFKSLHLANCLVAQGGANKLDEPTVREAPLTAPSRAARPSASTRTSPA